MSGPASSSPAVLAPALLRLTASAFVLLVAAVTLGPAGLRPHLFADPQAERLLAFLVLGYVLALAFPRRRLATALFVAALAIGLEAAQHLTPDRHGMVREAVIKAVGGLLGVAAVVVAQALSDLNRTPPYRDA